MSTLPLPSSGETQLELSDLSTDVFPSSIEESGKSSLHTLSSVTSSSPSGDISVHSSKPSGADSTLSRTRDDDETRIEGRKPWYRRLHVFNPITAAPVPPARTTCPEASASWFSRLTFSWIKPLLSAGRRRPLETNDVWLVNVERSTLALSHKFEVSFHKHAHQKHALAIALYNTFAREFWIGGLWQLAASLCQVGIPLALLFLLTFVTDSYHAANNQSEGNTTESPPLWNGLGLVVAILLLQLVQGVGINQFSYHGFVLGAQARGILVAAMFEKSTKISGQSQNSRKVNCGTGKSITSNGPWFKKKTRNSQNGSGSFEDAESVVNLMSSDVGHVNQAAKVFHLVWTAPITINLSVALVIYNLSYSAVPGIVMLMVGIPGLTFAVKSLVRWQPMLRRFTNARVSLTQEVLRHIGFVKLNAWESRFLNDLKQLRTKELEVVIKLLTTRAAMHTVSACLPIFASVISLAAYSATGHQLTPSTAFSTVVIFNTLRVPFASMSISVGQVVDSWEALSRLQEFLLAKEFREDTIWDKCSESAIGVEQGNFAWRASPRPQNTDEIQKQTIQRQPFSLTDINFSASRGELIAVVGATGSGKSSLICALAGQMPKTGGQVTIGAASRAVCPQDAWIQSATLKDNILFGKRMDHEAYDRVIKACALEADIEALPAGDETKIGERGANLSGGQRQRVNLARAVYADSDLVLLDDPLSSVDARVGRHLFKKAICGALRGHTRILVTHQRNILRRCDRVLWIENGRIRAIDTFSNLSAAEPDFIALLVTPVQNDNKNTQGSGRIPGMTSTETDMGEKRRDMSQNKPLCESRPLVAEESGNASRRCKVFTEYIRSSGHLLNGVIPVALLVLAQGTSIMTSLWLSFWVSNKFSSFSRNTYIAIWVILAVMQTILTLCFSVSVSILGFRASRQLLNRAIAKVVGAPMSFHDTQPLGRIVNLFTQDAEVVDQRLPDSLCAFLFSSTAVFSVCTLQISCFPWFLVALVPLAAGFFYVTAYYKSSAGQLKRHEVLVRGVMFSRFSESVSGMQTIKAYGMETRFVQKLRDAIDDMNAATFLVSGAQGWLTIWLDLIAVSIIVTSGLLVVFNRDQANPSISAVVLGSALALRIQTQLVNQQRGELEDSMSSAERLHHYCTALPEELSQLTPVLVPKVPATWPHRGDIRMENVNMGYRPEFPRVLKDLSINIQGGEKIGIVGRTGAGKSSVASALFRLAELSGGEIIIDGLDIKQVPLPVLRSRISIIPQDPTMFRGTVRSNLDPFGQHTDTELWDALRQVGMSTSNTLSRIHLESDVGEGGANYSQGERQLLSIARALLQNTRIIVCDEATSSLDPKTDAKVQKVMLKAFSDKTVLTIAHRLQTVLRYDRICVLDQGRIAELDTPIKLWERPNIFRTSIFRNMCDEAGVKREDFGTAPSAARSGWI
ncbi:P-loop containing nucleoside triphosphate hydrolase protein [Hypoxylon fuscum]|nr:P-loop containing nucleoside triphosphate hydrolase protein [Hypoxylon fuscum]